MTTIVAPGVNQPLCLIVSDRRNGETNLFIGNPANPNISTRDALQRAQELLGTKEADIRIFFDPNKEQEG